MEADDLAALRKQFEANDQNRECPRYGAGLEMKAILEPSPHAGTVLSRARVHVDSDGKVIGYRCPDCENAWSAGMGFESSHLLQTYL
jgi:hypothetical protein